MGQCVISFVQFIYGMRGRADTSFIFYKSETTIESIESTLVVKSYQ